MVCLKVSLIIILVISSLLIKEGSKMNDKRIDRQEIKSVLLRCVDKTSEILLSGLKKNLDIHYKSAIDCFTEIDTTCENIVIQEIKAFFPSHGILAEESGKHNLDSDYVWVIDPLDGTTNYIHRLPYFSISIGVEYLGEMLMGVVYNPCANELFFAEKGCGSTLNGQPISVSKQKNLINCLLGTGFPYNFSKTNKDFYLRVLGNVLLNSQGIRRYGSSALDLCYIACGRLDGLWEFGLKPWDIVAGGLIVQEASGKMTDIEGQKISLKNIRCTVASNNLIHEDLLGKLK